MNYTITMKQFHLSDDDLIDIETKIKKLEKVIPWNNPDFPVLSIILRQHHKRSLSRSEKLSHGHETINSPTYYDGTLDLVLPRKRIISQMLGKTPLQVFMDGFDELLRELKKYKSELYAI